MKKLLFIFVILYSSAAKQLFDNGRVETLIKKFVHGVTEKNAELQQTHKIFGLTESFTEFSYNEAGGPVRENLLCIACRSAAEVVFQSLEDNMPDDQITEIITTLCISMRISSYEVCHGAITLNLPIFKYIIRNTPEATARAFCSLPLQVAHDANYCPRNDPRFEWEVQLPQLPSETIPVIATEPRPLKVAIVTDTHLDPLYEAFGVGDCDEPTCCRKGQRPARNSLNKSKANRLMGDDNIVEKSSRNSEPAGFWGDYRNCDTPIWAFDDVIERIGEVHQDIDVVYYVGDTIDHGVWETTYELINDMNRYSIEKMRSTFGEHVMIVPVIGNHESQPTNQFAPSYVTEENFNTTWLYKALESKWSYYLPEDARETFLVRGEYSRLIRPGLRVIVINNNVAYRFNWWLVFDPLDAKKHLDWLIEELHKAELNGEKVHILAHLPPGTHDLVETWTREYNRIVNRFSSIIAAEFNGHVHSDEFKIFYDIEDGSPINVAWGGGCATAYTHYNLNYKIVDINTNTFEPENLVSYVYNVTEANLTPHRRPHWFPLYDMKNVFQLNDLSATSMNELVHTMTRNTQFLDLYSVFFSKMSDNRWPYCGESCKLDILCRVVVTVLWDRQKCEELIASYYANKRRVVG